MQGILPWTNRLTPYLFARGVYTGQAAQCLTIIPSMVAKVAMTSMIQLTKQFDRPFNSKAVEYADLLPNCSLVVLIVGIAGTIVKTNEPDYWKLMGGFGVFLTSVIALPGYWYGGADGAKLAFRVMAASQLASGFAGHLTNKVLEIRRPEIAPRLIDDESISIGFGATILSASAQTARTWPILSSLSIYQASAISGGVAAAAAMANQFFR